MLTGFRPPPGVSIPAGRISCPTGGPGIPVGLASAPLGGIWIPCGEACNGHASPCGDDAGLDAYLLGSDAHCDILSQGGPYVNLGTISISGWMDAYPRGDDDRHLVTWSAWSAWSPGQPGHLVSLVTWSACNVLTLLAGTDTLLMSTQTKGDTK